MPEIQAGGSWFGWLLCIWAVGDKISDALHLLDDALEPDKIGFQMANLLRLVMPQLPELSQFFFCSTPVIDIGIVDIYFLLHQILVLGKRLDP